MSAVIAPLLRSWISAANRRQSRSRKSPSVAVPPGNWCEIFNAVPAGALPNPSRAGAAVPRAKAWLLQLGAEGFIDVRPRRGAIVSVPSPTGLFEMFETMAEIESACGRLAARRLMPENDAAMETAHRACEAAARKGDSEQYYADNRNFHEAIYRASRNGFLADQAFALHNRLSAYRR